MTEFFKEGLHVPISVYRAHVPCTVRTFFSGSCYDLQFSSPPTLDNPKQETVKQLSQVL